MRSLSPLLCAAFICPWLSGPVLAAQPSAPPFPGASAKVEPPIPRQAATYFFRQLLEMPPAVRQAALADKSDEQRKVLLEKVREYELLPQDERERRLQLVELWSTLLPLMKMPPAERAPVMAAIREDDRKMIEERLQQWDLLPPDLQNSVLEHKLTIHYFMRLETSTPSQRDSILNKMPEQSRRVLEQKLEEWRSLPAEQRQMMYRQFNHFFELPPKEKEKALDAIEKRLDSLPEEERLKMEQSLQTFAALPPQQRQMCLDSFRKFANMSTQERASFLKNAERWKAMTPRERETWRNLVNLLPPPGPPLPDGSVVGQPPPAGSNPNPPPHIRLPGEVGKK